VFRSTRPLESDMTIRTAIVEDVTSYAEILRRYIEVSGAPVVCTGIYDTAEQALPRLIENPPDVAIVDIRLRGMTGIELVARLKNACPSVLCLILTSHDDGITIFTALKAGASGYLLKRARAEDIVSAIVQTFEGGSPMSPQIARRVVDYFHESAGITSDTELSGREMEVLQLLSRGAMYKEIGDQLGISLGTVRSHIAKIYEKLHVHSRAEAMLKMFGKDR
jgi:DNA-binding NarL/FixJ family response regulator